MKDYVMNVFAELGEQLSYVNDDVLSLAEKYLQGDDIEVEDVQQLVTSIRMLNTGVRVAKTELLKASDKVHEESNSN